MYCITHSCYQAELFCIVVISCCSLLLYSKSPQCRLSLVKQRWISGCSLCDPTEKSNSCNTHKWSAYSRSKEYTGSGDCRAGITFPWFHWVWNLGSAGASVRATWVSPTYASTKCIQETTEQQSMAHGALLLSNVCLKRQESVTTQLDVCRGFKYSSSWPGDHELDTFCILKINCAVQSMESFRPSVLSKSPFDPLFQVSLSLFAECSVASSAAQCSAVQLNSWKSRCFISIIQASFWRQSHQTRFSHGIPVIFCCPSVQKSPKNRLPLHTSSSS